MDNTEIHYLAFDADEMWREMESVYIDEGGDLLYSGDEKYMLLRGVHAILMQAYAAIDNALRMDTLRYAQRDYLKIYGEKRNCVYKEAEKATANITITFQATGKSDTIKAGEAVTPDGAMLYLLDDDVVDNGYAQTVTVPVTCAIAGSVGNGLLSGTQLQTVTPHGGVYSIYVATDAVGGMDDEDFEVYRERIRNYGLTNITTGPEVQYESAAKNVSTVILDANAINLGAGIVGVYLLLSDDTGSAAIIASVEEALNAREVRPLTDQVAVALATAIPYTLNVQYQAETSSNISTAIGDAVSEYQAWQDQTIGQPFNPDKLMAMLYQAGCTRVIWGSGSEFGDGGNVEYTPILANQYCHGTISLAVIP